MFCQKCGTKNPDNGKFCRSCGTDLGNVTGALTENKPQEIFDRKGRPVHLEGAIRKLFTGLAFLAVAVILGFTRMGGGWWFWMLIPAFGMIGSGIAQYMQIKNTGAKGFSPPPPPVRDLVSPPHNAALPPAQTEYVSPDSRYKTGDLVPPSVTDGTTRHLELDKEGETMTLPKMEK